jgi:hypothetical protein
MNKPRISIRISTWQENVLQEMSEALDTSMSMLVRTIVGDWLKQHEEQIYRIIDRKKLEKDANYKPPTEETEDIFGE